KKTELQSELEVTAEIIQNIINENAHTALDQEEYQKRYDSLVERFDATKANLELTTEQIKDKITRHKNLEIFLDKLRNQDGLVTEFDQLLWNSLVDFITVFEKDKVQVRFKNGVTVQL
ncbi:MAG TPA: recombinase family protein, partial [Gallicola sp.]|nr:recombinase family protein [Gallicola sp.]